MSWTRFEVDRMVTWPPLTTAVLIYRPAWGIYEIATLDGVDESGPLWYSGDGFHDGIYANTVLYWQPLPGPPNVRY